MGKVCAARMGCTRAWSSADGSKSVSRAWSWLLAGRDGSDEIGGRLGVAIVENMACAVPFVVFRVFYELSAICELMYDLYSGTDRGYRQSPTSSIYTMYLHTSSARTIEIVYIQYIRNHGY